MGTNNILHDTSEGKVYVDVEVFLAKDGDAFIAYCPALNLSTYGENDEDVRKAFQDALGIFIDNAIEQKSLERTLLMYGWTLRQRHFQPPRLSVSELKQALMPTTEIYTERMRMPQSAYAC